MDISEKILLYIFVLGFNVFFIVAGVAIAWMVIDDTALGRAIDKIMEECIERWRERERRE